MSNPTPKFNTEIPEKIMTPDQVSTRLGTLEFFDGMPTDATASTLLDHLMFLRGVEVFLNTVQVASLESARVGLAEVGATAANKVVIYDDLMDSNSLFLTGNTDTVYAIAILELDRDGPTVVEIPPGMWTGNHRRCVVPLRRRHGRTRTRSGTGRKVPDPAAGPRGRGARGLLRGAIDQLRQSGPARGFVVDGSTETASQMFRNGVKIYPLDRQDDPPPWSSSTGQVWCSTRSTPTPSSSTKSCTGSSTASRSRSSTPRPEV